MKQMLAPQAPVEQTVPLERLVHGFFRRMRGQGEIFYGCARGAQVLCFPVLGDGSVSNRGGGRDNIYPDEIIHTINPESLGIGEFKWTDEIPSA
jgi:hypothetical protein